MKTKSRLSNPSNKAMDEFVIAEYTALRDEIIKRSEFRYQLISLTVIIAGSILTFGLQPNAPASVLFIFPILGCLLAGVWAHNVIGPRYIAIFIKEHIESRFRGFGWETIVETERYSFSWLSGIIATGGIYIVSEIVTLVLGFLKSSFTLIDIVLIGLDIVAIFVTLLILRSATVKPKSEPYLRTRKFLK